MAKACVPLVVVYYPCHAARALTPDAAYAANREFYTKQGSELSYLIIRARAGATTESCAGSDAVASVMKRLLAVEPLGSQLPEIASLIERLRAEQSGSCTVQILTVIQANHQIMQAIHEHNDRLAPALVEILRPTIAQGVQMALQIELAKKRGE